jgi:DNA-binding HxlR family transcriptional regulator
VAAPSTYRHFGPTARALELVGERWSLLVVRDLLAGEQRFTDLLRSLAGITPKLLTQRLRELEEGEIVERDQLPGRREVWYRLTESGRALAPVVDALTVWGIEHAGRAPQRGESVHPRHVMDAYVAVLNRHRRNTALPRSWNVRFSTGDTYTLVGDGDRWWSALGETPGAAVIETTPAAWATFLDASPENALMLAEPIGPADEDAPLHAEATKRSAPRPRTTA